MSTLGVGMRRSEVLQGFRMLRLRDVMGRWEADELSQLEAAELLGMHERTFRRWVRRFEESGDDGLADRRLGRRSGRAVARSDCDEIERLYRERYQGFTAKHFHEYLAMSHGYSLSYSWTKGFLQARGLLARAPRRGAHRRKRPRRPMVGMMLHQDASKHAWLDGLGDLDLVVTMDDASSEIYSAILVEEEGTMSTFQGLIETIAAKGLFCSFYTDRGTHYFHTPEAGGKVDRSLPTQVGRALAQLGIEHIAAYSPEARGRSERMFRTLQGRLPKDLRLAGIATPRTPTSGCARSICRATTPVSQHRRPKRVQASFRWSKPSGAMCSAYRTSEPSRLTTLSSGSDDACRSRPIPPGLTSSGPRCASMSIPTAISPSSMARDACSGGAPAIPAQTFIRKGPPHDPPQTRPLWTGLRPRPTGSAFSRSTAEKPDRSSAT